MRPIFHSSIIEKLRAKHRVEEDEVVECFANVKKGFLEDTREDASKDPITYWFVEQTDHGRWLFVAFVYVDGKVIVKTAYDADDRRKAVYTKLLGQS